MNDPGINKDKLLDKISKFLKLISLREIITGLIKSLIITITVLFLFILVESFSYFSSIERTVLILLIILLFLTSLTFFILKPITKFFHSKSLKEVLLGAKQIGKSYPNVRDNLTNALQLISNEKQQNSIELVNAAFSEVYIKVKNYNFNSLINYHALKKTILLFAAIVTIFSISLISSSFIRHGASRLLNFSNAYVKPVEFTLELHDPKSEISKGESIVIRIKGSGKLPNDINISTKSSIESEYNNNVIQRDSNNIYSLRLRNVKNSFEYFAFKGDVKSLVAKVEVKSPPVISFLNFEIIPPNYSRLPSFIQENNGNITALKGSLVKYELLSTKPLTIANRKIHESKTESLQVSNKSVLGNFKILNEDKYFFEVFDSNNNRNINPIEYTLKVIPDHYPEIEIIKPEASSLIPNNDIISFSYVIRDDYGFNKLRIKYSISNNNFNQESDSFNEITLDINRSKIEQLNFYNWDISKLGLRENEFISLYFEISDNDIISGPKTTKSKLIKLRVPSLDELFLQANNTQEEAIEDLAKTMKEAEDLQKEFQNIRDDLKQNETKVDWNEKERVEESVKKFEEITDKIEDVQERLKNMQDQMAENNLLSEETMQKYTELQDLMNELSNDEMLKAMKEMQNALENLMRDKIQQSLDNLSMNEKMFQKSIERTLNLLKKIQIEQKMDELIQRTEKINEDLKAVKKETEKNINKSEGSNSEIIKDQKKISEQIEKLEKELQSLQAKMNEVDDTPIEKMNEIKEGFDEQKNQELSQETLEKLQEQNPFDALKNQQQLSKNMDNMQKQLQSMQKQMQQQSQQMVMQNMLKAIDNIISLSKEQEKLGKLTDKLKSQPRKLSQNAEPQMNLRQDLEKVLKQLSALSQKTFAITPEMGEALGKARNNMNNSIAGMQNRNGQQAASSQSESMGNLNQAAELLQSSLANMMQGGGQGSGGMMPLMQQLQQMTQQQMGLNQMTQMMKQGQLTLQQQAQLQRLAQEQGVIQKSLRELNEEARQSGESKKLSSNLEKILEDMQEVVSGLNTKKIDDDLIRTQEKILSKLLDAQRSINERDFEKNRESFAGKNFNLKSPEELALENQQVIDALREELLKSIQDGYSKDYEDLIRRYFDNLNNSQNN